MQRGLREGYIAKNAWLNTQNMRKRTGTRRPGFSDKKTAGDTPAPVSADNFSLVAEISKGFNRCKEGDHYLCKHYLYQQIMRRTIIFIPKGETEPISVVVHHKPELNETEHAGIWNIDTNDVWLGTVLWNQFPANDQKQQAKVFAQLHKMSNQLIK